jgi:hypothetical protein
LGDNSDELNSKSSFKNLFEIGDEEEFGGDNIEDV